MMASQETAAVLGAGGMMGFPMARNLARSGISVRAWNRSRDKAEPLAKDGAQVCDSPAEAAEGASVILTMLADADAVLDVVTGERGALVLGQLEGVQRAACPHCRPSASPPAATAAAGS